MTKETTGTTRKKRTPAPLNDFGKAVHHHLIDNGMTMADMEKSAGMSTQAFRKVLTGDEKPPRAWITNTKLDKFLRQASADAHRDDIEADYKAILTLVPSSVTEDDPRTASVEFTQAK